MHKILLALGRNTPCCKNKQQTCYNSNFCLTCKKNQTLSLPLFCAVTPVAIKLLPTFLCREDVENNSLGSRDREKLKKQRF